MKKLKKAGIAGLLSLVLIVSSLQLPLIASAADAQKEYLGGGVCVTDTFEYSGFNLDSVWEATEYNGQDGTATVAATDLVAEAQVVADPANPSNNVLKLGKSKKNGQFFYGIKSSLLPTDRKIQNFSFKIYMSETDYITDAVIYRGKSSKDSNLDLCNGVGLRAKGLAYALTYKGADARYWASQGCGTITSGTWADVSIKYIYDKDRLYGYEITVNGETKKYTYNDGSYIPLDQMKQTDFAYGFMFSLTDIYIDDVCFQYEVLSTDSAEDVAAAFKKTYKAELALTTSTAAESDLNGVNAALDYYAEQTDEVKALLETEYQQLYAVQQQILDNMAQAEIDAFKAAHSAALALTVTTATKQNADILNNAISASFDLSNRAQGKIATEIAQLKTVKRTVFGTDIDGEILTDTAGEYSDDFEYTAGVTPADIYETKVYNTSETTEEIDTSLKGTVVEDPKDSGNRCLRLSACSGESTNCYYTLNETYTPTDRRVEKLSLRYYTEKGNFENNADIILYAGMGFDNVFYQNRLGMSGNSSQNSAFISNGKTVNWTNTKQKIVAGKWCDIEITYLYDASCLKGWTIKYTTDGESYENTYTFKNHSNGFGQMDVGGFTVGFSFANKDYALIDDLKIEYSRTDDEIALADANEFKKTYNAFLTRDAGTITAADKNTYDAVMEAYAQLSEAAKKNLTTENAFLISATATLLPDEVTAINAFTSAYGALLSRETTSFATADSTALKAAYDAYENLSTIGKALLAYPYKYNIDAALTYINSNPTVTGDIANCKNKTFTVMADFEYSQNPFTKMYEDNRFYVGEIVDDPDEKGTHGKVFKFGTTKPYTTAYWGVDDRIWPTGSAQMKYISFDFYVENYNNNGTPEFIYDYVDEENYRALTFQIGVNGRVGTLQLTTVSDGVAARNQIDVDKVEFNTWVTYSITFNDTKAILVLSSENRNYSTTLNFTAGTKFGFGFMSDMHVCDPMYIDNVEIKLQEEDFDVDTVNKDIVTYYSGNTFQNANDTVLLTGAGLYDNVENGKLYVVPNGAINVNNPQYTFEKRFNSSEIDSRVTESPVACSWDDATATDIDFVQRTKTSIKFTLPKSKDKYIYAVKLKNKNAGYSDSTIYLNNPHVTYTMGDDGERSTQGGYLRLFGENLYLDSSHNVTVVAKSLANGATTTLSVTEVTDGDAYAVKVAIPENMAYGEYEVYLHNGLGDNTCWSEPLVFTVGASARATWAAKGFFNVKDYGAMGDDTTNDTPAIVLAIQAAYENGGGTVYFPAGIYRVITTIAVPANITICGESKENTMIFWSANRWQYGEACNLFSFVGNVEFKNLNIYSSRIKAYFKVNAAAEVGLINSIFGDPNNNRANDNIYFENLMLRSCVTAGYVSSGGNAWSAIDGSSTVEVRDKVWQEASVHRIDLGAGGNNYQVSDVDIVDDGMKDVYIQGVYAKGYNVRINNFSSDKYGVNGIVRNGIFENNTSTACVGIYGNNLYYARSSHGPSYTNNRELWVSDGIPYYKNQTVQFIGEREDIMGVGNTDEVTYKLIGAKALKTDAFAGMEIYVNDGQGLGQCRTIVSSTSDGTFKVDEPFVIAPNRNSKVYIYYPRVTNYFVQNTYEEGSGTGPWGTSIDAVWDGNTCSYHSGQQFTSNNAAVWYTTILNETYTNPLFIHGEGYGSSESLASRQTERMLYFNATVSPCSKSLMGTVIKNNNFSGWYIYFCIGAALKDNICDMIVEHNVMENVSNPFKCVAGSSNYFDGFYIRDNDVDVGCTLASDILLNASTNKCGYARCIFVSCGEDQYILGDVNLDGKVTIKDATMIRYYYVEEIALSEQQLLRADVNVDGEVNLKDATRIRQFVLGVVDLGKIEEGNGGYYPGIW